MNAARPTGCLAGEFFLDHTLWWENRLHEKSSNKSYSPARVHVQLVALDMQMGWRSPTSSGNGPDDFEPRRPPAVLEIGVTAETVSQLCRNQQLSEAVEALGTLVRIECRVSHSLFYAVLKQCVAERDLILGRRVHALAVKAGYESDTFLGNNIMRMYTSHARLQDAMDVFAEVDKPDAFTWSAIISAYAKHGQDKQAIGLYHRMRRSSVKPDCHVFVAALQACARGADLESGQQVHADVVASGVEPDPFLCNSLVDMYAKCGSLEEAQRVFDGLRPKNVVTWNAMISGYSRKGMGQKALHLYRDMREEGVIAPNSVTFVCLLQACASVGAPALGKGKQLHLEIRERGLDGDVVVGGSLVNMYAKCGSLEDAQGVFDGLHQKNVVTWTALIAGYSEHGMGKEALLLHDAMQDEGLAVPNSVTFLCLLQACASVGTPALEKGKKLHAQIGEQGLQADAFIASSLVNMYAKCSSLQDAQGVFDRLGGKNVVTWNAMIGGYSQQGMGQEALHLYRNMQEEGIVAPDSVTFACLLQACATVGTLALETGKQLHAQIRECELEVDVFVASSLVNMYAKCGSLQDAQDVFDGLGEKDVVAWNAMIAGYSHQGKGQEAIRLFRAMQEEGKVPPNSVTFLCLLQACADVAALQLGRQLHTEIEKQGLQRDLSIAVSLINMYAKSGSMVEAQQVFDALPKPNVGTWSALIAGYSRQGDSAKVFALFDRMQEDGTHPDGITFVSLLTACSHAGLVDKGQDVFEAMSSEFGIPPTVEHYTCMADLLGRAGEVNEALALVSTMPVADAAVWHTLLGACRKWSNVEVGLHIFHEAVKLNQKDAEAYVLMSNIYASAQMWEQAQEMQDRRKEIGAWKQPGQSWWTDMDGLVHTFLVQDQKHPESDAIYAKLNQLLPEMKKQGYLPLSPHAD